MQFQFEIDFGGKGLMNKEKLTKTSQQSLADSALQKLTPIARDKIAKELQAAIGDARLDDTNRQAIKMRLFQSRYFPDVFEELKSTCKVSSAEDREQGLINLISCATHAKVGGILLLEVGTVYRII